MERLSIEVLRAEEADNFLCSWLAGMSVVVIVIAKTLRASLVVPRRYLESQEWTRNTISNPLSRTWTPVSERSGNCINNHHQ